MTSTQDVRGGRAPGPDRRAGHRGGPGAIATRAGLLQRTTGPAVELGPLGRPADGGDAACSVTGAAVPVTAATRSRDRTLIPTA
ncbi:hypothetical protein [Pseudonocardia sp. WMMC193]|uniref:hypothetical protein n=1 Tax=Pseudonocardia sp. WMMC193 TaxID=2911965 RepID=UPI001F2937EA|nr:hypothetical protein [Pseudonocardia sp. WMMC193]MCF7553573.1 hypothetical protein [Pseudonocardia sp. WMMC193]